MELDEGVQDLSELTPPSATNADDGDAETQPTAASSYDPTARASLLLRHLQSQPYHRHIRASHRRTDDEDDVMDDDETQMAAARAALAANRGGASSDKSDGLSVTTWDSDEQARLAQEEWEESIGQLNLALQVMVLPFFGKWLGRKWSYWAFSRFQRHGLTVAFFGLEWMWTPTTIVPGAAVAALQP